MDKWEKDRQTENVLRKFEKIFLISLTSYATFAVDNAAFTISSICTFLVMQ